MISRVTLRRAVWLGLVLAGPIAATAGPRPSGLTDGLGGSSGGGGSGNSSGGGGGSGGGGSGGGSGGRGKRWRDRACSPRARTAQHIRASCSRPTQPARSSTMMGQQQGAQRVPMMLDYSASMQMDGKWTERHEAPSSSFVQQPTKRHLRRSPVFPCARPRPDSRESGDCSGLIPALGRLVRSGHLRPARHRRSLPCRASVPRSRRQLAMHDPQHGDRRRRPRCTAPSIAHDLVDRMAHPSGRDGHPSSWPPPTGIPQRVRLRRPTTTKPACLPAGRGDRRGPASPRRRRS